MRVLYTLPVLGLVGTTCTGRHMDKESGNAGPICQEGEFSLWIMSTVVWIGMICFASRSLIWGGGGC